MAERVVYTETGGPEVLRLEEVPDAVPGPGEVVVAVRAVGVNPVDWKRRRGLRGPAPDGRPIVPGLDAAGVVEAVGEGVDGVHVGDEVIVRSARGAYATQIVSPADRLVPKPAGLGWAEAASIGVPVGTAYQAVRSLGVGPGDTFLVHGGSGGVGQAAIQFAVAEGARGTQVSPGFASRSAAKTVSAAWSSESRKRVICGTVRVTGPPFRIWSRKSGITEPREASTLP